VKRDRVIIVNDGEAVAHKDFDSRANLTDYVRRVRQQGFTVKIITVEMPTVQELAEA
jgi:energy-coupling factor transporter ATP-binding protein EcfA2